LYGAITSIDSLLASEVPIGYQAGTFTLEDLTYSLGMARSRLVPLLILLIKRAKKDLSLTLFVCLTGV